MQNTDKSLGLPASQVKGSPHLGNIKDEDTAGCICHRIAEIFLHLILSHVLSRLKYSHGRERLAIQAIKNSSTWSKAISAARP